MTATYIGWKHNELLMYIPWLNQYWRWTNSYHKEGHKFEPLTDEHKEGWNL